MYPHTSLKSELPGVFCRRESKREKEKGLRKLVQVPDSLTQQKSPGAPHCEAMAPSLTASCGVLGVDRGLPYSY